MPNTLAHLHAAKALLLVVDLQEKLLPAMYESEATVAAAARLMQAMTVLGVPTIVTEQYPQGLGTTCPAIRALMGDARAYAKMLFSACTPEVNGAIDVAWRGQIIVAGIESHVCVQQTVLDLLRGGREVWVCADATSSRRPLDRDMALDRMRQAGAVVTTSESVIFELLRQAGGEPFKQILKIVK